MVRGRIAMERLFLTHNFKSDLASMVSEILVEASYLLA